MNSNVKKLQQSGFALNHFLKGDIRVAFDDSKRRAAFVYSSGIVEYDYSDFRTWNWHWVEKNGVRTQNAIHITLNDKNRPLIKVGNLSTKTAELWMAKLGAIINE
jgi:hypothetical protein